MQDSYTGKFSEQFQRVLDRKLPWQACLSESFSERVIDAAGMTGRIASIREYGEKGKAKLQNLIKTQANTEEDLQAQDTTGESSNHSRERPVISAPILAPQQPPFTQVESASENTIAPFQQQDPTSRHASQHEALESHPVRAPSEYRQNKESGGNGSQVEATRSAHPGECPLHADQDKDIHLLRNRVIELRHERDKMKNAIEDLKKEFIFAQFHASTDHRRAYAWEPVGPAPDAETLLSDALTGLRMIMLSMYSRIEWYERGRPTLREDYDNAHQV
ncbi:hypothetical protein ACHAPJ_009816 [Fusarium lateritium]